MKKRTFLSGFPILILLLAANFSSHAQAGAAADKTTPSNSSTSNPSTSDTAAPSNPDYTDDRLYFRVDLPFEVDTSASSASKGTPSTMCVPAHTTLIGVGPWRSHPTSGGSTESVLPLKVWPRGKTQCDGKTSLPENTVLLATANQVNTNPPVINGLVTGALVVPFKYHVSGMKDFTASATLGSYLGYKFDLQPWSINTTITPVGFAGVTSIPVSQNNSGQASTQNVTGLSVGSGVIVSIKSNFQVGGVFGIDLVSSSAGYKDNGKLWVSLEIGYAFLQ